MRSLSGLVEVVLSLLRGTQLSANMAATKDIHKTHILGIDPGSRCTGFAVIWVAGSSQACVTCGNIKTKGKTLVERLGEIYAAIDTLLSQHHIDEVAIEKVFVKNNVDSALKLGQARGAAISAVAKHTLPISEYSARQVKQACVGYGNAEKGQVQHMVAKLFRLDTTPQSDAADALAIALCHANHRSPVTGL